MKRHGQRTPGFTIVELLIVIVVIAILAAIAITAYNGIQPRSRDSSRKAAVSYIVKALEMYYVDKGSYPAGSGSTTINSGWSTTADASWANLETLLRPYTGSLPKDPISTPGVAALTNGAGGYNFDYYSNSSNYCGALPGQMYILVYKLEQTPQVNTFQGDCATNPLGPYAASNYRVVK